MRYPKDVAVWEYAPGRRIAQIVLRLRNVKGAMAQVTTAVSESEVNMLSGFESANTGSELGSLSFFADVTDSKDGLGSLRKKLLALPVVVGVDVLFSDDGFVVDRQHFPVRLSNRRALILRTDALSEMVSHMWQIFGTGAATIIDQMAEAMGRHAARELLEDFGEEFLKSNLDEALQTYTALGYAEIEVVHSAWHGSLTLRAKDLFECEANARDDRRRKSIFFRGHLRGFMSTVHKADFEVTETECVAEDGETCSFLVARVERLAPKIPLAFEEQR